MVQLRESIMNLNVNSTNGELVEIAACFANSNIAIIHKTMPRFEPQTFKFKGGYSFQLSYLAFSTHKKP
jgi:hypothetical protein